jgi:hypothetical protein
MSEEEGEEMKGVIGGGDCMCVVDEHWIGGLHE